MYADDASPGKSNLLAQSTQIELFIDILLFPAALLRAKSVSLGMKRRLQPVGGRPRRSPTPSLIKRRRKRSRVTR